LYIKLLGSDFKIPNMKEHAAHSCPDRLSRTDKLQYNKALASGEQVREWESKTRQQRRDQRFPRRQSTIRQGGSCPDFHFAGVGVDQPNLFDAGGEVLLELAVDGARGL